MNLRTLSTVAGLSALGFLLVTVAAPSVSGGEPPDESAKAAKAAKAKPKSVPLATPESFAKIRNKTRRSQALFMEASKVLTHARCVNCHPDGDRPLQGDDGHLHEPPVTRGADNHGAVGMRCQTCHQERNFDPGRVPGSPEWHLAPLEMAWVGKTPGQICAQIKDPKRNGNRSLADISKHMSEDRLVGWAWEPGADRQPPPGDQKSFGALIDAWIETGAACPK